MADVVTIGDMTIHKIVELESRFIPITEMLPELDPERLAANRDWLRPDHIDPDDVAKLSFHCYVVKTPHHTIMIDTCLGNDKPRARAMWSMKTDNRFLTALAAAGFTVEDIDYVMCTHLHVDHVGWNTRLLDGRWVPTFPRARYVFGQQEHAFWQAENAVAENMVYLDSVLPIMEAGRAELVRDDFQLGDHVRILPTPGHTVGHVAFCLGRGSDEAVMSGDLLHTPLQMRYPDLSFYRDRDKQLAAQTRKSFLERYCDTSTVCCTGHFPAPSMGRIVRWGDGFKCEGIA